MDIIVSPKDARRRRAAAASPTLASGARLGASFVVVGEAPGIEMDLRQSKAEGAVISNLRLVSLAAVVADLVCAMGSSHEIFGFLAALGHRVMGVAIKAIKMEVPREELREMLLSVRNDVAAVRDRVVLFPARRVEPLTPVAGEGGAAYAVRITFLADLKAYLQRFDDGLTSSAIGTMTFDGMVLQDATTAFRLLACYEGSVTNEKPLALLMNLDDCLTSAGARIDHLLHICSTPMSGSGYTYGGEQDFIEEDPPSPAQRLLVDAEEIVRLGGGGIRFSCSSG